MASLSQFAARMRQHGRNVERNTDRIVAEAAGIILQTVVLATPVDTGRARGGWLVGLGGPPSSQDLKDADGASTIANGRSKIAQRKADQTIFLSNSVEYIDELNKGTSAQAPANFVEMSVLAGLRAIAGKRVLRR